MAKTNLRNKNPLHNRRFVLFTYDWVGTLVFALAALSLLLAYAFRVVGVKGDSMLPSLTNGDKLLLSASDDSYRYGDVVVIDRYTDTPLIKRVIAVGGDTVAIRPDGAVLVNGVELDEPYIRGKTYLGDFVGEAVVPVGTLFVMGDNREVSNDSRFNEVGFVSEKDVVGRALYRVWPLRNFGKIR